MDRCAIQENQETGLSCLRPSSHRVLFSVPWIARQPRPPQHLPRQTKERRDSDRFTNGREKPSSVPPLRIEAWSAFPPETHPRVRHPVNILIEVAGMPSVAQEASEADGRNNSGTAHGISILAKKRRWDDSSRGSSGSVGGGNDVVAIFVHGTDRDRDRVEQHNTATAGTTTTTTFTLNTLSPSQRKIIPLGSKRLCLSTSSGDDGRPLSMSTSPSRTARESALSHHHLLPAQSITAPCHICHRRPRRKVDLDSLANCEGCGQRTCFVCLRECLGWTENGTPIEPTATPMTTTTTTATTPPPQKQQQPWSTTSHGHRRMVCSRCCVERGEDGDVVCLGCVAVAGE